MSVLISVRLDYWTSFNELHVSVIRSRRTPHVGLFRFAFTSSIRPWNLVSRLWMLDQVVTLLAWDREDGVLREINRSPCNSVIEQRR